MGFYHTGDIYSYPPGNKKNGSCSIIPEPSVEIEQHYGYDEIDHGHDDRVKHRAARKQSRDEMINGNDQRYDSTQQEEHGEQLVERAAAPATRFCTCHDANLPRVEIGMSGGINK
jgi:hypothetical protein